MKTCIATDCEKKCHAKGYCSTHYSHVWKYGHVLTKEEIKEHRKKEKGVCLNTGKSHFKKGYSPWNFGLKDWQTEEHKEAARAVNKARTPWNKGLYGFNSGENNPNWKGGVHSINNALRRTKRYANWRNSVFERDDYTCQECKTRGGYLEADHIKPFAFFPGLRFELSNGRTLCLPCHKETPTYKKHKLQETI